MTEERTNYHAGPTDSAEPPLATEALVAQAHAHRQGIPYETGDPLLARQPERLRALADHVLSGKAKTGDVAYAVAAPIDRIESAPAAAGPRRQGTEPDR
jgi:hypothetical protein